MIVPQEIDRDDDALRTMKIGWAYVDKGTTRHGTVPVHSVAVGRIRHLDDAWCVLE